MILPDRIGLDMKTPNANVMYSFVVHVDILQSPEAYLTKNHDHFTESTFFFESYYADGPSMLFHRVYGING